MLHMKFNRYHSEEGRNNIKDLAAFLVTSLSRIGLPKYSVASYSFLVIGGSTFIYYKYIINYFIYTAYPPLVDDWLPPLIAASRTGAK